MSPKFSPVRLALIGLGRIMRDDHLPAVLASDTVALESVCDPDVGALERLPSNAPLKTFATVEELLRSSTPEAAIVAVPHDQYLPVITQLASAGVHVLKEKPLAVNLQEAIELDKVVSKTGIRMMVTLQRRFNPIFRTFEQLIHQIGRVFYFDFRYTLNAPGLDVGWRARRCAAGGGCLIDMGYHTVDLLLWYFGLPGSVRATLTMGNREDQCYDVEDTCSLMLEYEAGEVRGAGMFGTILLSRVFPVKTETLIVAGTKGMVEVSRFCIRRLSSSGEVIEELTRSGEWPSAYLDQLYAFARWVRGVDEAPHPTYREHLAHVALIEAAYLSEQRRQPVSPVELLRDHGFTNAKK